MTHIPPRGGPKRPTPRIPSRSSSRSASAPLYAEAPPTERDLPAVGPAIVAGPSGNSYPGPQTYPGTGQSSFTRTLQGYPAAGHDAAVGSRSVAAGGVGETPWARYESLKRRRLGYIDSGRITDFQGLLDALKGLTAIAREGGWSFNQAYHLIDMAFVRLIQANNNPVAFQDHYSEAAENLGQAQQILEALWSPLDSRQKNYLRSWLPGLDQLMANCQRHTHYYPTLRSHYVRLSALTQ